LADYIIAFSSNC